jgi:2-polyprenyl-6-methoxyphenol hydroxylase-like FAD-dependent oxidoreductase
VLDVIIVGAGQAGLAAGSCLDGAWRSLADLDEVAVRITHVAVPFPAVIVTFVGRFAHSIEFLPLDTHVHN